MGKETRDNYPFVFTEYNWNGYIITKWLEPSWDFTITKLGGVIVFDRNQPASRL
jgi:hypothetical protein